MKLNKTLTIENINKTLDFCYDKATNGIPGSKSCAELSNYYLNKYDDIEKSAKKFISAQKLKCATSGFVTSFGGLPEMAITLPANLTSVIYIQLRMIATLAVMGGYEVNNDEVQTLAYICLTGMSAADIFKKVGIETANAFAKKTVNKIPVEILRKINNIIGKQIITKAGEKSAVSLTRMVPIAGGLVGSGVDYFGTKAVADRAYKLFILNDFS